MNDSEMPLEEVMAHMTPVGKYEFDLAYLRAKLARAETITFQQNEVINQLIQDKPAIDVGVSA